MKQQSITLSGWSSTNCGPKLTTLQCTLLLFHKQKVGAISFWILTSSSWQGSPTTFLGKNFEYVHEIITCYYMIEVNFSEQNNDNNIFNKISKKLWENWGAFHLVKNSGNSGLGLNEKQFLVHLKSLPVPGPVIVSCWIILNRLLTHIKSVRDGSHDLNRITHKPNKCQHLVLDRYRWSSEVVSLWNYSCCCHFSAQNIQWTCTSSFVIRNWDCMEYVGTITSQNPKFLFNSGLIKMEVTAITQISSSSSESINISSSSAAEGSSYININSATIFVSL